MGMRVFTKKFGAYALQVFEKKTGKTPLDIFDMGNFSMTDMIQVIRVGNGVKGGDFVLSEEDAGEKIDNFLEDENNTLIDVYLQLIDEYDRDVKLMRKCGMSVDDIREELNKNIKESTEKIKEIMDNKNTDNKVTEFPVKVEDTVKVESTDKVRVTNDGMSTLDDDVTEF